MESVFREISNAVIAKDGKPFVPKTVEKVTEVGKN
jgi:hypothetical protein